MGPVPVIVAGVIPARETPGVMIPGQFGPMMRVFGLPSALTLAWEAAKNSAVSCTGIPSVMTTSSSISASMASIAASLAYFGGTNMNAELAHVCIMVC